MEKEKRESTLKMSFSILNIKSKKGICFQMPFFVDKLNCIEIFILFMPACASPHLSACHAQAGGDRRVIRYDVWHRGSPLEKGASLRVPLNKGG